ncbi:MAG: NADH-quinone oxidoreductase subunit NuoN [Gammaproteobacteria bacterium]|nr:NADH-quinone oxidoreductase subunit NuoN [Gammaproteobacteria bacterium]
MNGFDSNELILLIPEIFVLATACLILVIDLFLSEQHRNVTFYLTQLSLFFTFLLTLELPSDTVLYAFNSSFILDTMAIVLKCAVYVVTAGAFCYARPYLKQIDLHKGEFYVLGLFAMLGMMVLISANHLLVLYLGLELMSLSLYTLVALNRDSAQSTEAAMKYFVLGAIASGMLLYGISILYGISGSLDIPLVADSVTHSLFDRIVLLFALSFIVVGVAFKLGAVPFHMWVPDVYQGAPTAVTVFVGSAPKIAAFAMAMRLLVGTLGDLHAEWQGMLIVLAVLSLGLGNVVAIAQSNIKRMLAYSTIGHIGFILMGVLSGTAAGFSAAMFYSIVYALMTLGAFGVVILMSRAGFEAENLDDYKGLNEKHPWFAFMMLVFMFSLAGVPPLVGFHAKLAVLRAVLEVDLVWLAIVAVLFSVVGAFYYLRIIKLMYFDSAESELLIDKPLDMKVALSLNGLLVLGLGIMPGVLMGWCFSAFA